MKISLYNSTVSERKEFFKKIESILKSNGINDDKTQTPLTYLCQSIGYLKMYPDTKLVL